MTAHTFDIIISGGAMTGATLALALSQQRPDLSIAVVERSEQHHHHHEGFDSRSIALSAGTMGLLDKFGLWPAVKSIATPIHQVHISDRGHAGLTTISHTECGLNALGYVVELAEMGHIFYAKLSESPRIALFCPDSIEHIERSPNTVTVTLQSGQTLNGALLVAADGSHSRCCQLLGHDMTVNDFHQTAVIATLQLEQPHQGRAFERFTSCGPVALLPMSHQRMSLVWCVEPQDVDGLLAGSDDEFLARLQRVFGWRLGRLVKVGKREAYPLALTMRKRPVSHRFVAVGNAAQTLHPIAGQGFNLGIRDVASLVEELQSVASSVGDYAQLSRYLARRAGDREHTVLLTSSLVHVFSNAWLPAALGRNLGLLALDHLPVLKRPLLYRTLGWVDR